MSQIEQAVQEFLNEMEWKWVEVKERTYRVHIQGENGQWAWLVWWDEDDTLFSCRSIVSVNIPAKRRPAAAEYITRANCGLRLGNLEMDYSDGQVTVRTSAPTKGIEPCPKFIRSLAHANFTLMDMYLPGLMAVGFGKASPKTAIEEAERPQKEAARQEENEDSDDNDDAGLSPPPDPPGALARPRGFMPTSRNRVQPHRRRTSAVGNTEAAKKQRIRQFTEFLRRMEKRTREEVKGSCFLIIGKSRPGSRGKDLWGVQFCFERDWFAMDIPNTDIVPEDAARVLKERRGFYREAERPDAGVTTNVADLVQFDPIGKKYIYGDEQEAAEDAAYVLFDVMEIRPTTQIRVRASAFDGPKWEWDKIVA